jgi:anaerobic ribonucleoside-triphosphate reductase activating protein
VERTAAEGPGLRFALWAQGCSIRCAGCCNPHLFEDAGGVEVDVADLLRRLGAAREGLDGVTLLGGEPFDQAEPLAVFARGARDLGLGVMTFTGHLVEDLRRSAEPGVAALLEATDLLVDGPYDARKPERERRWVGSSNQRFHFLTSRHVPGIERIAPGEVERTVEVRIRADGFTEVNGWPELARLVRPR